MRLADWEPRLLAYIASAARREHVYGDHDCMLHCAAVVEAVTGVDWGNSHRGQYSTAEEAAAYLASLGFANPAEMVASLLTEKPVLRALRGDIVLDDEGIPGVCMGGFALMVGMAERVGLVRVPRAAWQMAWAV